MYLVLFLKQKTAYELRISDWSSDVCSSDLRARTRAPDGAAGDHRHRIRHDPDADERPRRGARHRHPPPRSRCLCIGHKWHRYRNATYLCRVQLNDRPNSSRSEEHTSELQSLMRISSAVFCLKKKQLPTTHQIKYHQSHT